MLSQEKRWIEARRLVVLFWVALNTCLHLSGTENEVYFDRYTTNDGLSDRTVNTIFQDKKGFIWVGTSNGLNRFDGLSFKTYFYDYNDSTSIPGNEVNAIIEDTIGNLWILTNRYLCIYNRKADNFIRKPLLIDNSSYEAFFTAGYIDSRGYMWLSSRGDMYRFKLYGNPQIKEHYIKTERYILKENDLTANIGVVNSIIEDHQKKVWVASYSKHLFYFDESKNTFIPYEINLPQNELFSNKQKNLLMDRDNDIFIAIEWVGLVLWKRKTNEFEIFKPDLYSSRGLNDNIVFALAEMPNGNIWIGGKDVGGINILNKKTKTFKYLKHDSHNPYSLGLNKVNCFYRSPSNIMWVGLNNEINKYVIGKHKFKRFYANPKNDKHPSFNNTLCFKESKTGEIWIGTDGGGLNKYNPKTGKFTYFFHDPKDPGSLSSNSIISLCEDHEGTLWIGTYNGGLCRYKDGKFKTYLPDRKRKNWISYPHIWYIFEDSKLNLWVATLSNGLEFFDREREKFYNYQNIPNDSTSLSCNAIIQIYEDSKQNIYVTSYHGISVFNLNDYDFSSRPPKKIFFKVFKHMDNRNSLSSNGVYSVIEDNEKNLWFGTISTGIDKYDTREKRFTNFSTKDGLPGNSISSVLFDKHNHLWVATDKGLVHFDPKTKSIKTFDNDDGLQNKNFNGWATKTSWGEMYFCGPKGFNSFYPDSITLNTNPPNLSIIGLKIHNKNIKAGGIFNDRIILEKDISETDTLTLTSKEQFFTLEFIALDFTSPGKNQYAYKLIGFNKEWIHCGSMREAHYTNLDPGTYTFRLKAANNDGYWNHRGVSLKIIVLPAWYETLWFKVLVLFLLSFFVLLVYYLRLRLYKQRQLRLQQLVKIRTEELESKNHDLLEQQLKIKEQSEELSAHAESLKAANEILLTNQSLIQDQSQELKDKNEQLTILNSTRDKLFSIIAHDLRNPFNVISGFSDVLLNKYQILPPEKIEKYLQHIRVSSFTANNLLENLLHWSRAQLGKIAYDPEKIDLKMIIQENLYLFAGSAHQKNLRFITHVEVQEIYADENMIKTVFRNLISNAVKFSKNGGIVSISTKSLEQNVEIEIADTGIGIPGHILGKLFHPMEHITTKGTSNESGTGLGLLICKEFIDKHGGSIRIESEEDAGSKFIFTIPI